MRCGGARSWPVRSRVCPSTDTGEYFCPAWTRRHCRHVSTERRESCVCAPGVHGGVSWEFWTSYMKHFFFKHFLFTLRWGWHVATWKMVLMGNDNFPHLSENRGVAIKNKKKQINMPPPWLDHLVSNVLLVWGRQSLPCDEHTPCLGMQLEWVGGAV